MENKPVLETPPVKRGPGRPAFVPTDEQRRYVEELAGYGVPQEQIASIVTADGIAVDTLRAHFSKELQQGRARAGAKVGQTLFEKAAGGDTACAIFYAKTQLGWREAQAQQVAPVTINLAWLPAREVDIGANMVGVIEGQAQTIGNAGELVQDLRADDTKASE